MTITNPSQMSAFARIVNTRYLAGTVTLEQVTTLKTSGKITPDEFEFITGAA